MDQKFPSAEKLKSKKHIDQLFTEGKSVKSFPVILIYKKIHSDEIKNNKVGFSVPKRNFKKAVERNLLKRLLRESYRKNKYLLVNNINQPYSLMFIYIGKKIVPYKELSLTVENLLKQLMKKENL